jgi:L-cysteine S-thiosulfotransferase
MTGSLIRRRVARMTVALSLTVLEAIACEDPTQLSRDTHIPGANTERGRQIIAEIGCGACHQIPGIANARGKVGPSLKDFAERNLIAGRFPNRAAELMLWVSDAPALDPETGMPPMPLDRDGARDVAAYLLTLRSS